MAYDEFLADRARQILRSEHIAFEEKKMMGGLCFMVNEKMCFGLDIDKNNNSSRLMCRVGGDNYEKLLAQPHCKPMDLTGRAMRGYVFVSSEGLDTDEQLAFWIRQCLLFNPEATRSRKKPKKN
ncbi:TfoX/Sxy family protein [Pareuzebyella sediminis]|uniref:TfoX/Sxy family protein n=1 Tax=Pareuzebyella sediminis TaxID=2607998 RepID=UPI0011EF326D|nr:TfoX/Sxy family protein [Pareuzebyella sediminis]